MTTRKGVVAAACVAGAAVLVTGGILVGGHDDTATQTDAVSETIRTGKAAVTKGDLEGTTTKPGTLQRVGGSKITAGPSGTVTELPGVGTTLKPGDVLYRVDNLPVVFSAGALPQWRAFEAGMSDGPDVKQLEENLRAWGYLDQPATEHFDGYTTAAIRKWQKATGQARSGVIELGRIHFGVGDKVVSDRKLSVGDLVAPGADVYLTSGTEKVVTVPLPLGSPLAKVGGAVRVQLPVGSPAAGTVRSIGDPVTDDDGTTTVAVTIGLTDAASTGDLVDVDVSVDFVSDTRKGVLSVPVTALGAKAGGGFVVQVIGAAGATKDVTVGVGLFAGDRVEITSGGLKAGDQVVVPA